MSRLVNECKDTSASLVAEGIESARNAGYLGLIPGLERSPGEGNGYPLQYYGLENSMNCIVHELDNSSVTPGGY